MTQSKHQLNTEPIKSRLGPASIPVILMDTTKALSLLYIRKFAVFALFLRLINVVLPPYFQQQVRVKG